MSTIKLTNDVLISGNSLQAGVNTKNVLASGTLSTYSATQSCWIRAWGYSWSSNKVKVFIDNVCVYGGEDGYVQSTIADSNVAGVFFFVHKGQVVKSSGTIYYVAYGC